MVELNFWVNSVPGLIFVISLNLKIVSAEESVNNSRTGISILHAAYLENLLSYFYQLLSSPSLRDSLGLISIPALVSHILT